MRVQPMRAFRIILNVRVGFFIFRLLKHKNCPISIEPHVPDKTLNCPLLHTAPSDQRWLNGLQQHKRISRLSFELTAAIRMEKSVLECGLVCHAHLQVIGSSIRENSHNITLYEKECADFSAHSYLYSSSMIFLVSATISASVVFFSSFSRAA